MQSAKNTSKERSAGVVLFCLDRNERKYLLLHYIEGHWGLPKGHVEVGETDMQACIRELKEETGIDGFEKISGFEKTINYTLVRDGIPRGKDVIFFLGKTDIEKIVLSHEHQDYRWASVEEALKQITYDNAKRVLKSAEEFLTNS